MAVWWIPMLVNAIAQKSDNQTAQVVAQIATSAMKAGANKTNGGNSGGSSNQTGASTPTATTNQTKTFGII